MPALRAVLPSPAIWQPQGNIAIWRRDLPPCLLGPARHFAAQADQDARFWVGPGNDALRAARHALAATGWQQSSGHGGALELLAADIALLLGWFRRHSRAPLLHVALTPVRSNACRFYHTDMVGLRLLCSYAGPGTEWLPDDSVDRAALGRGDNAAVLRDPGRIERLRPGWAALLRGERDAAWTGRGIVHRSPPYQPCNDRLVLTIDEPGPHLGP